MCIYVLTHETSQGDYTAKLYHHYNNAVNTLKNEFHDYVNQESELIKTSNCHGYNALIHWKDGEYDSWMIHTVTSFEDEE